MKTSCYDFVISADSLQYAFESDGPKGKIRKLIRFTRFKQGGKIYFNLSFGDADKDGHVNDSITSNNNDTEKVLVTVARTAIIFTDIYPDATIYIEGSTASRTRLYQMGINRFWCEIEPLFDVFGYVADVGFEQFQSGKNYSALAAKRK